MTAFYKKELEEPSKALLFTAIMINNRDLIPQVESELEDAFSKIENRCFIYEFNHSKYYSREMGDELYKYFVSYGELVDKSDLPQVKIHTMEIEDKYLYPKEDIYCRKVNIDPGYLTHSKVILATSKNYSHRVYLGQGVFAELTYVVGEKGWKTLYWTYPDYREVEVIDFFAQLRSLYLTKTKQQR